MVLIDHHHKHLSMPQRHPHLSDDADDFNNMMYPEPPQGVFSSAQMEMNVSPTSFYPRPSVAAGSHEYPAPAGFDGVMYADAAPYDLYKGHAHTQTHHHHSGLPNPHHAHGHPAGLMSPSLYPEDMDGARGPSSNLSTASCGSAPSSAAGSPRSAHVQLQPVEWAAPNGLGVSPGIVGQNDYFPGHGNEYSYAGQGAAAGMEDYAPFEYAQHNKPPGYVDPSLIHPGMDRAPMAMPGFESAYPPPPAPAYPASPALTGSPQIRTGSTSPFPNNYHPFSPYSAPVETRRQSIHSFHSVYSAEPPFSGDESSKEKQRCPHPDCGKTFKDLKAHMLTHQTERPEKCPIQTCDYHVKGFARKYDKNRHTLTHYKGTMVCGFCPGSGSAAEKSFNRADVFKRHLTAVHGVEQTPPNSRKKAAGAGGSSKKLTGYAPDATGKCSTCSATFSNAQDFYEHLDDCVLRIVQQEDPAEAVNAQRLAEVEADKEVLETLEKNHLPTTTTTMTSAEDNEEDDDMMDGEDDDEDNRAARGGAKGSSSPTSANRKKGVNGSPAGGVQKSRGMTHSRGGVALSGGKSRGRKSRRDYPSSWGFDKGQMTMKKRVMTVFDGARRLAKDDMMLSTEHEVRVRLSDGRAYVTDLDVQTMKRAEGFHGATDEEKGPWISDDPTEEQLRQMGGR